MPKRSTTAGQLLLNAALPAAMRNRDFVLDKKGLASLLEELGQNHPDEYRDVSHALLQLGNRAAYFSGGNSFGLKALTKSKAAQASHAELQQQLAAILDDDSLDDATREQRIIDTTTKATDGLQQAVYDESLAEGNPLAMQLKGAGRGNQMNLSSLRAGDLIYVDHHGKEIPVPVTRSYSQGLDPTSYWAGAYGARKGVFDVKFQTQQAGYLGKQLSQINHRLVVTADDEDEADPSTPPRPLRGYPVDVSDADSAGALLAHPAAGYDKNTILTPKILRDLRAKGVSRILVRSPIASGPTDGGVYARDVGVRERGRLPLLGEAVGLVAAGALSEPLNQSQLSSKHSGGVRGAASATGNSFDYINSLIAAPKKIKHGAAHAEVDGRVHQIEPAPAGGNFVSIGGIKHYVSPGFAIHVKPGDVVEAGDVISEGVPNQGLVVQHKGIGAGRAYFVQAFRDAFQAAGLKADRRNVELLSRGLINHVRLTDEVGSGVPDDVVPYSILEHEYEPREGTRQVDARAAVGKYLERPVLHHSIGTKIRPSMLGDFKTFGVTHLDVHDSPPPFEPVMVRGMQNLSHDPDPLVRMLGSGLKGSLLKSVHTGGVSDPGGTSYVPALAKSVDFGQVGKVVTPKPSLLSSGGLFE